MIDQPPLESHSVRATKKLAHEDVMAQPRRRSLGQRAALWLTAFVIAAGGSGVYLMTEGRPVSQAPLAFHLEELAPAMTGINFVHNKQLVNPFFENVRPYMQSVSAGACVCDVDRDGLLDVYLLNARQGTPNKLYRNAGNFRFVEQQMPAIENLNEDGYSVDCVFADVDNDGFDDLLVSAASHGPRLFHNISAPGNELGRSFVDISAQAGLPAYMNVGSATFLDVENDGDLDLLISNYLAERYDPKDIPGAPYLHHMKIPDSKGAGLFLTNSWGNATNGGTKHFLLNDATGRFTEQDLTTWGLTKKAFTWDIGTGDIDRDGFTDLYIANDFGPDELLMNQQGRSFKAVTGTFPTDVGRDSFKGMNADLADINHDGYPEIYITNIFHPVLPEGNILWLNQAGSSRRKFRNVAAEIGVKDGGWGWGAKFVDLDGDTDLDIIATNGMISDNPKKDYWYRATRLVGGSSEVLRDTAQWPPFRDMSLCGYQVTRVFVHEGSRFYDRAGAAGVTRSFDGRGVVMADFDLDGRSDVLILVQGGSPFIARNRFAPTAALPEEPGFVGLKLTGDGKRVNSNAVGARVKITPSQPGEPDAFQPLYHEVSAGNGFAGQSMYWIAAGLGRYRGPVDVEIWWTDGRMEVLKGLPQKSYHSIVYGEGVRPPKLTAASQQ